MANLCSLFWMNLLLNTSAFNTRPINTPINGTLGECKYRISNHKLTLELTTFSPVLRTRHLRRVPVLLGAKRWHQSSPINAKYGLETNCHVARVKVPESLRAFKRFRT